MNIVHFYHVYAAGDWEKPVEKHADALRSTGLVPDYLLVGLVGSSAQRRTAVSWFRAQRLAKVTEFTEAESGFEQVTLNFLHRWVQKNTADVAILYAHSKGAYNISPVTNDHHRIMSGAVIGRWREAVELLDDHDAVGCFWEQDTNDGSYGCFIGNFWWAARRYLALLPELDTSTRFPAETWIGRKTPKVRDLRPDITYADIVKAALGPAEQERRGVAVTAGTFRMNF